MCGIAGVMTADGLPPSEDILARLAGVLTHRGPDGSGRHIRDNVGFAHTRLAIIDLAQGQQPFIAADGVSLIANGEIYNDPALRLELDAVDFATGSDCESALHLYRRDGQEFARGLRGMYAIAVHDPARRRLILARDPFGIKPLYYAETPKGFFFASEAQALVAAGAVTQQTEAHARDDVLAFNFGTRRETPLAGIHRVLPGETLIVDNARIVARSRIGALPLTKSAPRDDEAALADFDAVWRDSVFVHQRSDVPYGMFLSGGIDSSAVLAMMARLNEKPVLAFTAAFPGTQAHDERVAARAVAAAAGAMHIEVEVTAADFWKSLPAIAGAMDDPAADYAVVPTYLLARQAARDVKVVLTGEGGDELFAGYGRYRAAMRPWPFAKQPWRRHNLERVGVLRDIPANWREGMQRHERDIAASGENGLPAMQALDCAAWLPNDLLLKLDRCLMAHGVEGRVPFLDPNVAAFAASLSDRQKIRDGHGKWLLRQWLAAHFPAAEALAPKRGFTVPVVEWMAAEGARLGPLVARQQGVAELCRPGSVEALFGMLDRKNGGAAWTLLFYALWHRRHIIGLHGVGDVFSTLAAS
jgi:asparagine synthase (glutamine-hydrolysing)